MNVELYVKRYFWVFWLLVVAVGAYLAARSTNHLIEAKVLIKKQPRRAHKPKPFVPTPGPANRHSKEIDNAMAHNVFCSSCPAWVKPSDKPPDTTTPTPPVSDPNNPSKSALALSLLSTQLSVTHPSWHRATIRDNTQNRVGHFGVSDVLPAGPSLTAIEEKRVVFNNNGVYEYIDLEGWVGPAPTTVAVATPVAENPPPVSPEGSLEADLEKGIKKNSDVDYTIERGLVDKLLADTTTLARSARIVPSVKDNKPNGFKLYAIRPNSVYAKIGLMNGDTLQAVNNMDMSTPAQAIEVYTKLRSATNFTVTVVRRGETKTMNYTIK